MVHNVFPTILNDEKIHLEQFMPHDSSPKQKKNKNLGRFYLQNVFINYIYIYI